MEKTKKIRIKTALRLKEIKDRHQRIQNMLQFDEVEYNNHQFEFGMKFLEQTFAKDNALVKDLQKHKTFWFWWIKSWNQWEAEYLEFVDDHKPLVHFKDWEDEMNSLVGDYRTLEGFKNYLKLFHNVRLH